VSTPVLTDSHAHLSWKELREDLDEVLARAADRGVKRVVTISCRIGDYEEVLDLAAARPELLAAVGVHPHEAKDWTDDHAAAIGALAGRPEMIAVGEMGLDYHYDNSPRELQQEVFARQIRLAHELGKPIVVHTREAEEDTARILEEERAGELGGVIHCFTSSGVLAERSLAMGFAISFSGIVTYPSAKDLQEVAKTVPSDRLLVETDSPYLSPAPHRGKWPNEPARVRDTAEFLAKLRGETIEDLAASSEAAFERAFRL
jgi:TatD DNase family protein